MPKRITTPQGVVEFPDDTPSDEIVKALSAPNIGLASGGAPPTNPITSDPNVGYSPLLEGAQPFIGAGREAASQGADILGLMRKVGAPINSATIQKLQDIGDSTTLQTNEGTGQNIGKAGLIAGETIAPLAPAIAGGAGAIKAAALGRLASMSPGLFGRAAVSASLRRLALSGAKGAAKVAGYGAGAEALRLLLGRVRR